jgi:uncharacterized protein
VAQAYTLDTLWRNRIDFVKGRHEAEAFLRRKWAKELEYRLIKELWAVDCDRLAVRCVQAFLGCVTTWLDAFGYQLSLIAGTWPVHGTSAG